MSQEPAREVSELSVVVPLHDERDNVAPLVAELLAFRDKLGLPCELILVDDGSQDGTARELALARASDPAIRVLSLPTTRGQSAALLAGVRASRMRHVATLDGDLQNDPLDLLRLLPLCRECDVAIGRRARRRDRWSRALAGRVANRVRRAVLRDPASDTGCSLRIFPRALLLELPAFDGMHRFLPALFQRAGATLSEIEVHHRERHSGRSKYTNWGRLRRTLPDLFGVWWLARRHPDLTGLSEEP